MQVQFQVPNTLSIPDPIVFYITSQSQLASVLYGWMLILICIWVVLCLPAHPLHMNQTLPSDIFLGDLHLVPEAGSSDRVGVSSPSNSDLTIVDKSDNC